MKAITPSMLLPVPVRMTLTGGGYAVRSITGWRLAGMPCDAASAGYLGEEVRELLPDLRRRGESAPHALSLILDAAPAAAGSEAYRLQVKADGIAIAAPSPRALYWGLQTLRQLMACACGRVLPCMRIDDHPAFGFRGYSDDISRRQISTPQDFEFIITNLSRIKYNVYQPYIEDVISIDSQPYLGLGRGRLSRDDVARMTACGKRHFVDIMPQFNSCSHAEHMLGRPEYAPWRFRGNLETLDPRNPAVLSFLDQVYRQMFTQFDSPYFHMGMDEARGLGRHPDLYIGLANRLAATVRKAGRRPIMWHDMFAGYNNEATEYSIGLLDRLDRSIILDLWDYGTADPGRAAMARRFLKEASQRGFSTLLSPCLGSGACGSGTDGQWRNTAALMRCAVEIPGVIGVLNTSWNDAGAIDRHLHWRAHAVSAELLWRGSRPLAARPAATAAFARHFLGLAQPKDAALLDECASLGQSRLVWQAAAVPAVLAQTVTPQDTAAAAAAASAARRLHGRLAGVAARTPRNPLFVDHVAAGLETVLAGARRVQQAPALRRAVAGGRYAVIEAIAAREIPLLEALRRRFAQTWLRRNRPEGLEFHDLRIRGAIADLENLAGEARTCAERFGEALSQGFIPLDCSAAATQGLQDLAGIPVGGCVLDTVPWRVADPWVNHGKSLVWLGSAHFPKLPRHVTVAAKTGKRIRRVHFLHAVYGRSDKTIDPGHYVLHFADGSRKKIAPRPTLDIADWWMPYKHPFGGGGALCIDTRRCRVAYMSGRDAFQGHCLYHHWVDLGAAGAAIDRVEITAGNRAVSLITAGITLEAACGAAAPVRSSTAR